MLQVRATVAKTAGPQEVEVGVLRAKKLNYAKPRLYEYQPTERIPERLLLELHALTRAACSYALLVQVECAFKYHANLYGSCKYRYNIINSFII